MRSVDDLAGIAGSDGTRFEHPVIPSGPSRLLRASRHRRLAEPDAKLVARPTWLRNLDQHVANPDAVADADAGLVYPPRHQVLAEAARLERPAQVRKLDRPLVVVLRGVMKNRHLRAAMILGVGLLIALKTGWSEPNRPLTRQLVYRRQDLAISEWLHRSGADFEKFDSLPGHGLGYVGMLRGPRYSPPVVVIEAANEESIWNENG